MKLTETLTNPVYLLGPPLLVFVSLPLAIFALLTTGLAITTLTFRLSFIYIELGAAVVQSWLSTHITRRQSKQQPADVAAAASLLLQQANAAAASYHSSPTSAHFPAPAPPAATAPPADRPLTPTSKRRHHRRQRSTGATVSTASSQDSLLLLSAAPGGGAGALSRSRRESWASLVHAASIADSGLGELRDYEGVGGWRVAADAAQEAAEDALWLGINSRLELPASMRRRSNSGSSSRRHHRRSLTGGSGRWGGAAGGESPEVRMSPVQSRSRTPMRGGGGGTVSTAPGSDYFDVQLPQPTQGAGGGGAKRADVQPLAAIDKAAAGKGSNADPMRRKSVGGSSTSSSGSTRGSRTSFRQAHG